MTTATMAKGPQAGTYHSLLYARALHPGLFTLRGRATERRGDAQVEAWVMSGAHLLRCGKGSHCVCELVTDRDDAVPTTDVVSAVICVGDQDVEHEFETHSIRYFTSVQTESLSENLYLTTLDDLTRLGEENRCMQHFWEDEAGRCLSMIELCAYDDEIHAHCYHLQARGRFVLRTLTMFAFAEETADQPR